MKRTLPVRLTALLLVPALAFGQLRAQDSELSDRVAVIPEPCTLSSELVVLASQALALPPASLQPGGETSSGSRVDEWAAMLERPNVSAMPPAKADVKIEPARPEDVDAIVDIHWNHVVPDLRDRDPRGAVLPPEELASLIKDKEHGIAFVARDGGIVAGYSFGRIAGSGKIPFYWSSETGVRREHRGAKLGKRLILNALHTVAQRGILYFKVVNRSRGQMRSILEALGFEEKGEDDFRLSLPSPHFAAAVRTFDGTLWTAA